MNEQPSKIYLLPNLMTAGNLFCGFTATLKILEGALLQSANADLAADRFHEAIWFILGAFVFDFLDGRLARLGGHDTVFGREFDSLADIVSFGLAPALMVYRVVLNEFPNACWIIAFVYLACGALRLARFNSAAAANDGPNHQNTLYRFSHTCSCRFDCVNHAVSPLACRRRTPPRQLALRSTAVIALSLLHDV